MSAPFSGATKRPTITPAAAAPTSPRITFVLVVIVYYLKMSNYDLFFKIIIPNRAAKNVCWNKGFRFRKI
jgi:hypothetical protein